MTRSRGRRQIEVLEGGLETTIQDYPGRPGLLAQGFFPAGPMDHFAFRAANLLVGNEPTAAGLEVTLGNVAFRVESDAAVAICGAPAETTLNGEAVELWESLAASAGSELRIGIAPGPGFRLYIAMAGGFDVPLLSGSRSTYTMGQLGGFEGRALTAGDQVPLGPVAPGQGQPGRRFAESARPSYSRDWEVEVLRGPQASPDFLTEDDMSALLSRVWRVDPNSNRTGIRLEPHAFEWARAGGGVAGGHPSNILDNSYPVGAVNVNGDLPVILGPDGPTAGGFVCAATVAQGAFWKIGQMRPVGDTVRFREVTLAEARALADDTRHHLAAPSVSAVSPADGNSR